MEKEIVLFSLVISLFSALLGWVISDIMQRYSHGLKNAIIGVITGFVSCIILSFLAREMYLQHIKSQMATVYDTMSYYSAYNRDSSEDGLVTVMCLITFGCILIVCGVIWYITKLKVKEKKRGKNIILAIVLHLTFMLTSVYLLILANVYFLTSMPPHDMFDYMVIVFGRPLVLLIFMLICMSIGILYTSWKAAIVNVVSTFIIMYMMLIFAHNTMLSLIIPLLYLIASCIWIVRTIKKQNQILADN